MTTSIESQFWVGLKDPEPQPFELEVEIAMVFPKNIYDRAEQLICWAFKAFEGKPTLVGFPIEIGGKVNIRVTKCYATINEHGIAKEILVHNTIKAYKLRLRDSASSYAWLLNILKCDGLTYFDSDVVRDLIQETAYKKGLI